MAQIEKRPELFANTSDDELLLPSQVASIFGIPTDALKSFMRIGGGPLPTLVDLKVRYRFGDVRAFYWGEEFQKWLREYDESERARTEEWKALFQNTFSNRDLPEWFLNEMRLALRGVAREFVHAQLSEQIAVAWNGEFQRREMETLPAKVFERAQVEAGKHLGRYFENVLADPKVQALIHERAIEQVVAKIEEHPAMRELCLCEVDQDRVREALMAATEAKEKGWVYLVQGGNHSDIKIGKASSLQNRLSNHRASNPRLRLVASFRGYTALESRLHAVFHPYRTARQWFIFSLTIQEFLRQAFTAGVAWRPEVTGPYGENEQAALAGLKQGGF